MDKADVLTQKIQKINLKTYKVFAELCEKHQLRYFAISGTSVGVHFWKGFIPWDDDMDIAMPIEDFEKFRKIFYKELPKPYGFIELPELGGKIYDSSTTLIEAPYAFNPSQYYGVFIDIVPLIGLPDDPKEREEFALRVKRYIVEAAAVNRAPELKIFTGQTPKKIAAERHFLTTTYPFGTTKYCTDLSCIKCPFYLTEGFLKPEKAPFEDTTIPISSQQPRDLKVAYKNLTKDVPKSERQLVHHNFYAFCDINTPFSEYQKSFASKKEPAWFNDISYKNNLYGASSAREAGLYKNLCQELEKQLENERKLRKQDSEIIRNSASYKLGNSIIKPFNKIKTIFKK